MKVFTLLLASLAFFGVLQVPGDRPEAYPGQREDKEPPKDWMCRRPTMEELGNTTPEQESHFCACERVYDADVQWMHEDKNCAVYCHMDHCSCPIAGMQHMPEGQQ